jgi:hypothetical protein
MRRKTYKTEDYILLSVPENPDLFAVQRKAEGKERFVKADPTGEELGPVYEGVTYLVSPFTNYETGRDGESCTCLSWRTRHRRCIHLKKFYEMNPALKQPDIYEDTCLHPGILADSACKIVLVSERDRTELSRALEERAIEKYCSEAEFREKLSPCLNGAPVKNDGSPEAARDWLIQEMVRWAKTAGHKAKED